MRVEAADARVDTAVRNESYLRLSLLTIGDLLDGTCVVYLVWSRNTTYNSAPWVPPPGDQAR